MAIKNVPIYLITLPIEFPEKNKKYYCNTIYNVVLSY